VDAAGDLVIKTPAGEMRQRKPTVYQEVEGARRSVEGGYVVSAGGRVRFALGEYDRDAPLVIDPAVEYSTHLGGSKDDYGYGIAADSAGNAYVTGWTMSPDFPTANAFQSKDAGQGEFVDAFVTKLNAGGSALVYSTYLGGSRTDMGRGIAVDSAGNAYVTGQTLSTDFPTANAVQGTNAGAYDAFVTKLNADGSALVYSTYLGGINSEVGYGIAADSAGNAYVTGDTGSPDFPTANARQIKHYNYALPDAFVTKLNADGSAFIYSTYLGGSNNDSGYGIAVDSAGNAYVTGETFSTDFPKANAFQGALGGSLDAFVTKLNADGSALVYSTFLGGRGSDHGYGIAVDSSGNAYVTGATGAADFPTANAIQSGYAGGPYGVCSYDAFVTKLNADGSALVYSTYLGGDCRDLGRGIAADSSGNAYVTGYTLSLHFPTANAIYTDSSSSSYYVFATKLNADGSAFIYSTYLGAGFGYGIAADSAGNAYVTGAGGPSPTPLGFQRRYGGGADAFVTKITVNPFIQGRVFAQGGAGDVGVPWVTVKLTGTETRTMQTNARGYYSFTGLTPGGDYTVTPTKTNLSFVPPSRTFTDLNSSLSNVNFTVPSLSVNNVTVTEGDAGEATATFTLKLTPASTEPVTVNYRTINGVTNPATAGADYTALPLTQVTFAPGETAKTVAVTVKGDALDEANETFLLRLSAPANALISDNTGVCVITDDDALPSITIGDRRVTEPDTGTVNAAFKVTLSAASGRTVTVRFKTTDGTATGGTDYAAVALTTLTFSPGQTSKTVTVQVNGDTVKEANETFFVKLSAAINASIADAEGLGKITNDD
jgi:hypothetical protein